MFTSMTAYLSYWQLVILLESCLQVFYFQNTDCFCSGKEYQRKGQIAAVILPSVSRFIENTICNSIFCCKRVLGMSAVGQL